MNTYYFFKEEQLARVGIRLLIEAYLSFPLDIDRKAYTSILNLRDLKGSEHSINFFYQGIMKVYRNTLSEFIERLLKSQECRDLFEPLIKKLKVFQKYPLELKKVYDDRDADSPEWNLWIQVEKNRKTRKSPIQSYEEFIEQYQQELFEKTYIIKEQMFFYVLNRGYLDERHMLEEVWENS